MTIFLLTLLALAIGYFLFAYHLPLRRLQRILSADLESAPQSPSLKGAPIVRRIFGQITGLLEKNSENMQRAEDEGFNLRAILSSMREGVILLDDQRRIRLANDEIYRLLPGGLSPINRSLLEIFRNHHLHRSIETSFTTTEPQMTEFLLEVLENGHLVTKTLEVTSMAMKGRHGEIVGALAVFHDVTRLKALEAVRREFVANVSHELRTPLSIISGYIETMLDDDLEDVIAGRKFLKVMHKHTERLHLLVEDLLTISTLESHRAILTFSPSSVQTMIEHVIEQLDLALTAKDLQVQLDFPTYFPLVEMDAHRIEQVFSNLLDNAVKHGRAGDAPIRITGRVAGDTVRVSVCDHGPGVPLKDQPHIFERFYRVDQARSREVGGTGLGLSIVKHVVQAHGGTVDVTSRPGEGATFIVSLPLHQSGEKRAVAPTL